MKPTMLENLPDKIRVVLTNLLTWLVGLQTLLSFAIAEDYLEHLPWPEVSQYAILVLGWLGAVIVFIRRVTPVTEEDRGLLPQTKKG